MAKKLLIIGIFCVMLFSFAACTTNSGTVDTPPTSNDGDDVDLYWNNYFVYANIDEHSIEIRGTRETIEPIQGKLVMPATIYGDAVKKISDSAFENQTQCEEIVMPLGVEVIGAKAFKGCTGLKSITIPSSVREIGASAFANCINLEKVYFDDNQYVSDMSFEIFSGCSSLAEITLPKNLQQISAYAFAGCSSLAEITLPDSVRIVREYAFAGCSSITEFDFNNASDIAFGIFPECSKLVKFKKSETNQLVLTDDGRCAYVGTTLCVYAVGNEAKELTLKEDTEAIGEGAFWGAANLQSITLPLLLKYIHPYAFNGCTGLNEIVIYQLCGYIGREAFANCSLDDITIFSNGNILISEGALNGLSETGILHIPNSMFDHYAKIDGLNVPLEKIKPITFQITYNTNGGSTLENQTVIYGEKVELNYDVEKPGFVLDGWFRSNDEENGSGERFYNGSVYRDQEDIVLYAKWH